MKQARGSLLTRSRRGLQDNAVAYLLLTPFLVFFFLFTVLPVLSSIVLSFTSYDMLSFPRFAGLANYLRMFAGDEVFPLSLIHI